MSSLPSLLYKTCYRKNPYHLRNPPGVFQAPEGWGRLVFGSILRWHQTWDILTIQVGRKWWHLVGFLVHLFSVDDYMMTTWWMVHASNENLQRVLWWNLCFLQWCPGSKSSVIIILLLAFFVSGCTEQYWVDNSSAKSLQIHQCVTQSGDFTLSL